MDAVAFAAAVAQDVRDLHVRERAFADLRLPRRARDLCQALDLPIVARNTESIRSRLKRLVSRGILAETEPGLLIRPRP